MESYGVRQLSLDPDDKCFKEKMDKFKKDEKSIMAETPLRNLQTSTFGMIQSGLSSKGKLVDRFDKPGQKIYNDYRGIAELCGIGPHDISAYTSPAYDTLREMGENQFTMLDLIFCLICINRSDLVKNCRHNILSDCRIHVLQQQERLQMLALNDDVTDDDYSTQNENKTWLYNAFLSAAQTDSGYARLVVKTLEKKGYKIFYPERDLLPGQPIHTMNAFFIEERCEFIIIIVSQAFSKSPECSFHLKFSKALDPASRARKIIPITFDANSPLPRTLNYITLCDMTTDTGWPKLFQALQTVHRVNKKALEQIKYPQRHPMDVSLPSIVEDLPETLCTRHQPEGQELGARPKTESSNKDKKKSKPSLISRSKSYPSNHPPARSELYETTV